MFEKESHNQELQKRKSSAKAALIFETEIHKTNNCPRKDLRGHSGTLGFGTEQTLQRDFLHSAVKAARTTLCRKVQDHVRSRRSSTSGATSREQFGHEAFTRARAVDRCRRQLRAERTTTRKPDTTCFIFVVSVDWLVVQFVVAGSLQEMGLVVVVLD